jgi:hypothetical protein
LSDECDKITTLGLRPIRRAFLVHGLDMLFSQLTLLSGKISYTVCAPQNFNKRDNILQLGSFGMAGFSTAKATGISNIAQFKKFGCYGP